MQNYPKRKAFLGTEYSIGYPHHSLPGTTPQPLLLVGRIRDHHERASRIYIVLLSPLFLQTAAAGCRYTAHGDHLSTTYPSSDSLWRPTTFIIVYCAAAVTAGYLCPQSAYGGVFAQEQSC